MTWKHLTQPEQLEEIKTLSHQRPVLLFKHSTRCSVSATALGRLERNWNPSEMDNVQPYYLDLITYRLISNQIAQVFGVEHQSPQVLLIRNGQCVYHASHWDISYAELAKQLADVRV